MPFIVLLVISTLATWFAITDARRRNMNAARWGMFVMFTAGIGVPVYLMMRKPFAS